MTGQEVAFLRSACSWAAARGRHRHRRPASNRTRREVRVTVAPNAIPRRRAATLAHDVNAEPPRAGPRRSRRPMAGARHRRPPDRRPSNACSVPRSGPAPVFAAPAGAAGTAGMVPVPMGRPERRADGTAARLADQAHARRSDRPAGSRGRQRPPPASTAAQPFTLSGLPPPTEEREAPPAAAGAPWTHPALPATRLRPTPVRRAATVADERCEVASRARVEADEPQRPSGQRSARTTSTCQGRAGRRARPTRGRSAPPRTRPRSVPGGRARATRPGGGRGRGARLAPRDQPDQQRGADASATLQRSRGRARQLGATLERLTLEADAARIAAETAEDACLVARAGRRRMRGDVAGAPARRARRRSCRPASTDAGPTTSRWPPRSAAAAAPRIFRLLRGDRAAMVEVVDALAGDDPDARRRWQGWLTRPRRRDPRRRHRGLCAEFPDDHPFWGPFTLEPEPRHRRARLSSLGYRFDGMGGWVDDRVPSQRDLSLALGYAGLDPMRIRRWPTETEMAQLFRDVAVAADEYLAGVGRRPDARRARDDARPARRCAGRRLERWGRIRPLLLEER